MWLAKKVYRRGYNRLASGGTLRKSYNGHWLDGVMTPTKEPVYRLLRFRYQFR